MIGEQTVGWKLLTTFRVIFVMGGPASGKGTVCTEVVKRSNSVHVSSGDLLRREVQRRTPLGLQVKLHHTLLVHQGSGVRWLDMTRISAATVPRGKRNFVIPLPIAKRTIVLHGSTPFLTESIVVHLFFEFWTRTPKLQA